MKPNWKYVLKFFLLIAMMILVVGYVVMLLWNWLMPNLFGLPLISLFEAVGLFLLSKILFGNFPKKKEKVKQHWKNRMKEKWNRMSPEEQEVLKNKLKCSPWKKWVMDEEDKEGNDLV